MSLPPDTADHVELLAITRLTAAYFRGELRPSEAPAHYATDASQAEHNPAEAPPVYAPPPPHSETRRVNAESAVVAPRGASTSHSESAPGERAEALERLRASFANCALCAIAKDRHNLVFGQGNPRARLMIIGEGPGEQEDLQGIAFCGPSGELLTKMLRAIGLSRDEVYIANIIKCRPPRNRNPLPEEVAHCRPFLDKQIDIIQPALICLAGGVAAKTLLDTQVGIMRLRGTMQEYRGIPVVPTYHPSFLLRDPRQKRSAWEDMQLIQRILNEGGK